MNRTRNLSQAWLDRRARLHALLEAGTHRSGNASVLQSVGSARRVLSEEEVAAMWAEARPRPGTVRHVYVHVPFCKSICHFCNYTRLRAAHAGVIRTWFDRLLRSLEVLGPAASTHPFHTLYVGGGTPSLLPAEMLDELFGALDTHLRFHPHAARTFEADPAVLDERKLEVLRRHGVQHVAMGVQTFDPTVNAAHDRGPQGADLVARRVDELRRVGIPGTSFDFLLGLHDTEPERVFDEIDEALARFRPRWVDVFFVTPTPRYVDLHFGGSYEAFWAHQRRFAELAPSRLGRSCLAHGYRLQGEVYDAFVLTRVGGGPVERAVETLARLVPGRLGDRLSGWLQVRSGTSPYSYTQSVAEQGAPLDLLGLGAGARSRIFGRALLTCRDPGDDPERAGSFEYVGDETDLGHECRAWLADVLRNSNRVPFDEVRRLFGAEPEALFPEALAAWARLGIAHVEGDVLQLAPSSREERYRQLMWLLDDRQIEAEIAHRRHLDLSADALVSLAAPLSPGDALSADWRLGCVEDAAFVLVHRDGAELRVRVAPALDRSTGLDLLPEARGAGDLAAAVGRLKRVLSRNGADELGIRSVPVIDDGPWSHAGQHAPAPREGGRRARPAPAPGVPPPVHDPSADPPRPLDPAAVETYWRDGWVGRLPILTPAEVARFRGWLEQVEAEQAARHGGRWTSRSYDPDVTLDHPLRAWADELIRHPRLLDAVESVLGPDLVVRNVDVFVREPHTRDGVAWHRDSSVVDPVTDKLLTAWLALNPATPENGAMQLVAGSHRGLLPGEHLAPDALTFPPSVAAAIDPARVADDVLEPGQASLHHLRTVHRSGGNRTAGRRIGVVVRFAAGDTPAPVLEGGAVCVVRGRLRADGVQARDVVAIGWHGRPGE